MDDDSNIGFTPDPGRGERCGFPEVIYAAGKTPDQVTGIAKKILSLNGCVLSTRTKPEAAAELKRAIPDTVFLPGCGIAFIDRRDEPITAHADLAAWDSGAVAETDLVLQLLSGGEGSTMVICAGTSDLPVTEEAAITSRIMGSATELIWDVGVAGVHRLLAQEERLRNARAIAVVAGMEGALPSLVAGLVDVPVVAVPTSVGYGASFNGLAALLGMLNSCAGGVSVVNIDNGFGAGVILDRINRPPARFQPRIDDDVSNR